MKKSIFKIMTLLVFASVMLSSCSVEYRDRHRKMREDREHDQNNNNNNDHHYKSY